MTRRRKPLGGRRRPRIQFTRIWVSSGLYSVTELIVATILDVNSHTHTNPRVNRFLKRERRRFACVGTAIEPRGDV